MALPSSFQDIMNELYTVFPVHNSQETIDLARVAATLATAGGGGGNGGGALEWPLVAPETPASGFYQTLIPAITFPEYGLDDPAYTYTGTWNIGLWPRGGGQGSFALNYQNPNINWDLIRIDTTSVEMRGVGLRIVAQDGQLTNSGGLTIGSVTPTGSSGAPTINITAGGGVIGFSNGWSNWFIGNQGTGSAANSVLVISSGWNFSMTEIARFTNAGLTLAGNLTLTPAGIANLKTQLGIP